MTLRNLPAPFLRRERTVSTMMADALFALALLLILPTVQYGPRALLQSLAAMAACAVCDILYGLVFRHAFGSGDPSALVTGLTVSLLLPVNTPYWLGVLAGAFAILIAKAPFGSTGRNLFKPRGGRCGVRHRVPPGSRVHLCRPGRRVAAPFGDCAAVTAASPGASLHAGLKPSILPLDLLWGMYPGPMGCTAALVLGAAALFLLARRCIRPESIACFLLTAALAAALFPRIACPALTSVKYELLTGSLLFCAVFLLGDPVTSPRTTVGRCLFGVLAGGLLMAMRQTGSFEQAACFAVLIADAFAPVLDHAAIRAISESAMKETARELRAVFGNGFLFYNPVLTAALSLYPAAVCASLSQRSRSRCCCSCSRCWRGSCCGPWAAVCQTGCGPVWSLPCPPCAGSRRRSWRSAPGPARSRCWARRPACRSPIPWCSPG